MNIIVCIKQVPSAEALLQFSENNLLVYPDENKWIINPFDEYSVEAALQIKESHGARITAISLGSPRVLSALRKCLAMGVDEAIYIRDDDIAPWDSMLIANALTQYIRTIDFDLIFTGQRGIDCEMSAVGAYIAHNFGVPLLSNIINIELESGNGLVRTWSNTDKQVQIFEATIPAVIVADKGLNEPRSLSLHGIRLVKDIQIREINLDDYETSNCSKLVKKLSISNIKPVVNQKELHLIKFNTPEKMARELFQILRFKERIF